jgi:hypothetical protein
VALYEISDNMRNNILVFLDRIQLQGIKEAQALTEIVVALSFPVKDEKQENFQNKEVQSELQKK